MATYCSKHPEFELSHICTDCNIFLCINCTLEHSNKHKVTALVELATEVIHQFCREHDENAKIATDINMLQSLIKKRISDYWDDLKRKICSNIDDFKADSLKFIEGVMGKKERQMKANPQTKDSFVRLFKDKKYFDIYKNKGKMQIKSRWADTQKRKKELLATIYQSLPSNNFNLEFHNAYLLQLEQNLYSAVDSICNANYGIFIDDRAIHLLYAPSYVKTVPLADSVMNSEVVQAKNCVYLVGGNCGKWDSKHLNTTFAFYLAGGVSSSGSSLVPKASMMHARAWHGLVTLQDQYVYAIGGYNDSASTLNSCERYIIEKDKWIKVPSLKKRRWGLSATLFNNQTIYAFFGVDGKTLSMDIEALDCMNEDSGWILAYNPDKHSPYFRRCHASFQSSNTEILIFGGDTGQQLASKCLGYCVPKRTINYTANDCACRPHPTYFHSPDRMRSSTIYKLAFGNQAAVYDMVRKYWILLELCPLDVKR